MVHPDILIESRDQFRKSHGIYTVCHIPLVVWALSRSGLVEIDRVYQQKKLLNQKGKVYEFEIRELNLSDFLSEYVSESIFEVPKNAMFLGF